VNNKWDGIFYMDIGSYFTNFSMTSINKDTEQWKLNWFLMHNDETTDAAHLLDAWPCQGCSYHKITVTNDGPEDQDVYVGAHVWQSRAYMPSNDYHECG
jgi:hypothetical protein